MIDSRGSRLNVPACSTPRQRHRRTCRARGSSPSLRDCTLFARLPDNDPTDLADYSAPVSKVQQFLFRCFEDVRRCRPGQRPEKTALMGRLSQVHAADINLFFYSYNGENFQVCQKDNARSTSVLLPITRDVRSWSAVGALERIRCWPSVAAPPACSASKASGFASYMRRSFPPGAFLVGG